MYSLNELLSSETHTQGTHTSKKHVQKTTSTKEVKAYTEQFTNTTMAKSIKMTISTISILSMIIGLKVLRKCQTKDTQDSTVKNLFIRISTGLIGKILKARNAYSPTISQRKEIHLYAKQNSSITSRSEL